MPTGETDPKSHTDRQHCSEPFRGSPSAVRVAESRRENKTRDDVEPRSTQLPARGGRVSRPVLAVRSLRRDAVLENARGARSARWPGCTEPREGAQSVSLGEWENVTVQLHRSPLTDCAPQCSRAQKRNRARRTELHTRRGVGVSSVVSSAAQPSDTTRDIDSHVCVGMSLPERDAPLLRPTRGDSGRRKLRPWQLHGSFSKLLGLKMFAKALENEAQTKMELSPNTVVAVWK